MKTQTYVAISLSRFNHMRISTCYASGTFFTFLIRNIQINQQFHSPTITDPIPSIPKYLSLISHVRPTCLSNVCYIQYAQCNNGKFTGFLFGTICFSHRASTIGFNRIYGLCICKHLRWPFCWMPIYWSSFNSMR